MDEAETERVHAPARQLLVLHAGRVGVASLLVLVLGVVVVPLVEAVRVLLVPEALARRRTQARRHVPVNRGRLSRGVAVLARRAGCVAVILVAAPVVVVGVVVVQAVLPVLLPAAAAATATAGHAGAGASGCRVLLVLPVSRGRVRVHKVVLATGLGVASVTAPRVVAHGEHEQGVRRLLLLMLRLVLRVLRVLLVSTRELERRVECRAPHSAREVHPVHVRRGRRRKRPRGGRVELVAARLAGLARLVVTVLLLAGLRLLLLLLSLLLLTLLGLLTGLWLLTRLSQSVLGVQLGRRMLLLGVRRLLCLLSLLSRRMEHSRGAIGCTHVRSHWRTGRLLLLLLLRGLVLGSLLRRRLSRLGLLRGRGLEAIHGGGLDRGRRVASASASRAASAGAVGRRRRRRVGRRDPPVAREAVHWPFLSVWQWLRVSIKSRILVIAAASANANRLRRASCLRLSKVFSGGPVDDLPSLGGDEGRTR